MDPVQVTAEDVQAGTGAVLALLLGRIQSAEIEIAALKRALVSALDGAEKVAVEE